MGIVNLLKTMLISSEVEYVAHWVRFESFQLVLPSGEAVTGAKYDAVWFSPRKKRRDGEGRGGGGEEREGDGGGNGIRDWTLHMISR